MGVVVRSSRYIDILIILLFPTPLVLARFPTSLFIYKMCFRSCIYRVENYV